MTDLSPRTKNNIKFSVKLETACLWLTYLCAQAIFFAPSARFVLGPVMAVALIILSTTDDFYKVIPLLIVGNIALGNIIVGKVATVNLIFVLTIFRQVFIKRNSKLKTKYLIAIGVMALYCLYYWAFQYVNTNFSTEIRALVFYSFSAFIALNEIDDDEEKMQTFFAFFAISVTMVAAECVFIGRNTYPYANDMTRVGIIGANSDDPNFAGMQLLLGYSIMLFSTKFKKWQKLIFLLLIIAAITKTVSITAFVGFVVITAFFLLVYFRGTKTFGAIIIACVAVMLFLYLVNIGVIKSEFIKNYEDRIIRDFDFFRRGDIDSMTTGRTSYTEMYLEYFNTQPMFRKFFGGNTIPVPGILLASHNTYVDLLIRFGGVGAAIILFIIIRKYFTALVNFLKYNKHGEILAAKTVLLFYSAGLTIYCGAPFISWFVFLLVL